MADLRKFEITPIDPHVVKADNSIEARAQRLAAAREAVVEAAIAYHGRLTERCRKQLLAAVSRYHVLGAAERED